MIKLTLLIKNFVLDKSKSLFFFIKTLLDSLSEGPRLVLLIAFCLILGASTTIFVRKIQDFVALISANAHKSILSLDKEPIIFMNENQIKDEDIKIVSVSSGNIIRKFRVSATIEADSSKLVRVAAKVHGVVAQLRKRLGAVVEQHEVIAVIDSREIADAKSEYLAAKVSFDLQANLFDRERGLFEKKITAEILYLKAKAAFTEAKLRLDLARQKLSSLDVQDDEISGLEKQPLSRLREKEIVAPISGKVLDRLVNIGQPVTNDTQLYVIVDLSEVEVYLSVPSDELSNLHKGQSVELISPDGVKYQGEIEVINSVLTPETRMAKVIADFKTPNYSLSPGTLLTAEIETARSAKSLVVPLASIQIINNQPSVFVRADQGFALRSVELGEKDAGFVEIRKGLVLGERIAIANTASLKHAYFAEQAQGVQ
jgi:membrane fusion protein, heavy metal efflux system